MYGKRSGWVWILAVMLVVSACGTQSAGNGSGETYTLNVGTALTESDPIYQGLMSFKERVEERTNGEVAIEIFGSGALGEDSDILEQAKVGANVAVLVDSGRLAEMVPEIGILSAPYIVDNYDEANTVAQSELFQGWADQLAAEHNLQILSFNWYQGGRHILTNKLIETPDDLQGVILRTPGAPIWTETIKAMGGSASGLAWSEVYSAISQGVIDGAEAQHPATYGANLHEVIDHIALTGHFQLITGIVTNAEWIERLPEEYQEIIFEEVVRAGEEASRNTEDMLDEFQQRMTEEGVQFNEVDVELFKERTDVVYDQFDGYRELQQEVNQILGK